ncbi:hypothetical protein T4A_5907 [Trichinella pseudospiralis]|uniref:Uncharacterized protein n=1 Tax=Trichinella pseudospiralis TaxID=6337 RepID=A0A0V1ESL6_TRIPS|nr:hypothetical protein T4A_5907 [Trichinella pseudospiralis]KRZ27153.1 hypothetical protein T4C_7489 [Trichinella pseudospiralis]KRZ27156.1 hypothetical protein T4C_13718 [Trichinella pseudospiralis]
MSSRKCLSNPDSFFHICGSFVVKSKRQKTDFVKKAYFAYFVIKLGDQDKTWAPHIEVAEKPALTVTLKWSMEIHLSYLFTQCELNDLVRDLGFPKVGAEILGSRLQSKHMLAPGITVWMYRKRETEFTPFFRERRLSCVF